MNWLASICRFSSRSKSQVVPLPLSYAAILDVVPLIKRLAFLLTSMLIFGVVRGSELRRRFPFELWLIIASAKYKKY